jgi:hypothetical protein
MAKKTTPSKKKVAKPAEKINAKTKKNEKTPKSKGQSAKKKPAGKKKDTLMCFLTTACMSYYSLPDDAYELNTLRQYRDSYLASSEDGKKLIRDYYRISPEIVKLANADAQRKTVFAFIYSRIKEACREIEKKNYHLAKTIYLNMVESLMLRYTIK